ncbi:ABC transporter ATP-binding protein [Vagococcus acidifermentans]|uniref:ABC transporter ATP-binding protein n=1 Tax=Vagococcus acidifermentans TaxID=564710 RepID=A0A430ASY0_9ENTE|nr:ABC transporter ATP-binding protein [Vagococcus acidifermentans]RSU11157.1 ABC transporter ATP-binding protein [Vagococcus acidifermentans]
MIIVKTTAVKKIFGEGETAVQALRGISLTINDGEFIAIVGTSGSGKSTLLHILGGLDYPTSGKVVIYGKNLADLNDEELTIFRRRNIGFVFQKFNLVPMLTAWENIIIPVRLDSRVVDTAYLERIVQLLGLEEKKHEFPNNLSGGQQQRVAIARALATKPAIILADEPTGNLDSKTSQEVLSLLRKTNQEFGQTIVMITHNEEAAQLADRILRLEDGQLVSERLKENDSK